MANPEQLAILKQGVKVWNEWREKNFADKAPINFDFSGADLTGVDLTKGDFSYAVLQEANLISVRLKQADLTNANLRGANLERAYLSGTNFLVADLREANLSKAILPHTIFEATKLDNSNFSDALFLNTILADVDLSKVKSLESARHESVSTIDIGTIYRSRGYIPEVFLRGCGVPEDMIAYARLLRGKAFDFYSCFISHSAKDKRFCERLYADLQAKGVRVWYFPEDAKWGETVWGEIDRSIKVYDKLIVVCSENSLQSGPVNREIERALNREDKEGKNILFPIRIDDYIFDKWEHERKADVLRKVVGDFSGWDKDAAKYEKAFDKLLKGLQAG